MKLYIVGVIAFYIELIISALDFVGGVLFYGTKGDGWLFFCSVLLALFALIIYHTNKKLEKK